MIALTLTVGAVLLLALAHPRQALLVFGARGAPARRRARWGGWTLLAVAFAILLASPDRARAFTSWVTGAGVLAVLVSLLLSAAAGLASRDRDAE